MIACVIAIGSRNFVDVLKREPGVKAKGRRISGMDCESALRERQSRLRGIKGSRMCF